MRILIIAQQWEPEEGTPQRRWAPLVEGLIARDHIVDVVAPPPHYPGGTLTSNDPKVQSGAVAVGRHGETVWRCNFSPHDQRLRTRIVDQGHVMLSSIRTGLRLVKRYHPDVVIATAPPLPAAYAAACVGKLGKTPYIVDLRDVWPDLLKYTKEWTVDQKQKSRSSVIYSSMFSVATSFFTRLTNKTLDGAAGIVTTTPSFAERLRDRGYKNVVNVRNLGSVLPQAVPPRVSHNPGSLKVLYLGTTGRAQGLSNVISAVRLAQAQGTDIQMRIIGSGASLAGLKDKAEGTGIEFLGRIPRADVMEHYEWTDTSLVHLRDWAPLKFCVPSKFYEALSSGRHVTVVANGEVERIINETGAGMAVPAMDPHALADAWTFLANNLGLLEVGDRGTRWLAERETPDENANKFVDFVEHVANESE
ncbi:glycosyltransferase family 4 protein [Actinomycetaceae bacterium MB13-C1-2]|nr:glycosyltransferase family 4 protein [Actinomycetaceae bacterium MB13-C1-2]